MRKHKQATTWDKNSACCHLNHVQPFATLWTVAHQAPLSVGFSRQVYYSGLPRPPPGNLPNPRIEPTSLMSPALAGRFFSTTWVTLCYNEKSEKVSKGSLHLS